MYKQTTYKTTARDIDTLISVLMDIRDDCTAGVSVLIDDIDFVAEESYDTITNSIEITVHEA